MIVLLTLIGFVLGFRIYQAFFLKADGRLPFSYNYSDAVGVFYMYPGRCVDCSRRVPPTCEDCDTFYGDAQVLDSIGSEFDVPINPVVSDTVYNPSLYVVYKGRAYLTIARSKHNIAEALCTLTFNEKACEVLRANIGNAGECFSKYGIEADTVIYYYSMNCPGCDEVDEYLSELAELDYDGKPYTVRRILMGDSSDRLPECAAGYYDIGTVPQLFCPSNLQSKKGKLDLGVIRDFAEDCIDASAS